MDPVSGPSSDALVQNVERERALVRNTFYGRVVGTLIVVLLAHLLSWIIGRVIALDWERTTVASDHSPTISRGTCTNKAIYGDDTNGLVQATCLQGQTVTVSFGSSYGSRLPYCDVRSVGHVAFRYSSTELTVSASEPVAGFLFRCLR